jgi:predicted nucleotidyltransferase
VSEPLTAADVQRALDDHRAELARLGVDTLSVFGSVARGDATGESDVDFLVEFNGGATLARYFALRGFLEELLRRKVDLVTRKSLRARVQHQVEKDAVRVA